MLHVITTEICQVMSLVGFAGVKAFTKRIVGSRTAQMDCFSRCEVCETLLVAYSIVVRLNKQTRLLTPSLAPAPSSVRNFLHTEKNCNGAGGCKRGSVVG
jgi:hypothetical protein